MGQIMLMLLFKIGDKRYAIDTASIAEIVPTVEIQPLQTASSSVVGLMNYQNALIPVISLCRLLEGTDHQSTFGTRIILVNSATRETGSQLFGLIAENVTETLDSDDATHVTDGAHVSQSPYVGQLWLHQQEMIQSLEVESLISA